MPHSLRQQNKYILETFLETLWKSEEQKSRSRCSVYCSSIPTEVEARYDKVIKWKIWSSLKFYYRWYFRLSQPDSDYTISTQHSQYLHMLSVFSGHGGLGRNMSSKMRRVFPQARAVNKPSQSFSVRASVMIFALVSQFYVYLLWGLMPV